MNDDSHVDPVVQQLLFNGRKDQFLLVMASGKARLNNRLAVVSLPGNTHHNSPLWKVVSDLH